LAAVVVSAFFFGAAGLIVSGPKVIVQGVDWSGLFAGSTKLGAVSPSPCPPCRRL
jgi:hypothetical protein